MTVVIAGCGDIGTEAGLRYVAAGHHVMGLRRSPEVLPDSFARQAVDLSTDVPSLPADTSVVVVATSAGGRTEEAYRSAYVSPAKALITAIQRDCDRPPRVLFVSSTALWGIDDGSRIDETTPAVPSSPTAAILLEAEEALRGSLDDVIVLRLGGIYGPGRGRLIRDAQLGQVPTGVQFTNRIHRDDAAAAIVHLTTMTTPADVYLGVDDEPIERAEVLGFIAAELDLPPIPATIGRASGKRCDNARLRATGFEFTYPTYREGYRAILAGLGVRHP